MKQVRGWWLPDSDTHFEHYFNAMQTSEYQAVVRNLALAACKERRLAVDVGGHIGLWSRPLAMKFEHVIAFEPEPSNHALFKRNVPDKVALEPVALGAELGMMSVHVPQDNTGMAHLVEGDAVPVVLLDSYAFENVDFIKIDCEGYEYPVVRGAEQTLRKNNPVVVVEQKAHPYFADKWKPTAAKEFLESLGYKAVACINHDWIMKK